MSGTAGLTGGFPLRVSAGTKLYRCDACKEKRQFFGRTRTSADRYATAAPDYSQNRPANASNPLQNRFIAFSRLHGAFIQPSSILRRFRVTLNFAGREIAGPA